MRRCMTSHATEVLTVVAALLWLAVALPDAAT
jgi:hypothetical protein